MTATQSSSSLTHGTKTLAERYRNIRAFSHRIIKSLSAEDCMVQSMPDTSPMRWHLAHTTWFFETFVLEPLAGYEVFDGHFKVLFNSYYNAVGDQFPRPQRGLISRPGLDVILDYRQSVDDVVSQLLENEDALGDKQRHVIEVGLHHEQQHQELMLTDLKHILSCNPTLPAFEDLPIPASDSSISNRHWLDFDADVYSIGWDSSQNMPANVESDFCYDNEQPRHRVFLEPFSIACQPVTCGDFIDFMEDGGYERPELWLSLGWNEVQQQNWNAPLYWLKDSKGQGDPNWCCFTLAGLQSVDRRAPVCHLSYFEADAFARWAGARLPTEAEWEVACYHHLDSNLEGNWFADRLFERDFAIHPGSELQQNQGSQMQDMLGGVWEWTSSSYNAYPGYCPPDGALGEYNGKFMCNQYVLRGGSVATSRNHIRPTYRNFFPASARWQFSGLRLARS